MKFHLTVNHEGVVSLWDTPNLALQGASNEQYVELTLTTRQTLEIRAAQIHALRVHEEEKAKSAEIT